MSGLFGTKAKTPEVKPQRLPTPVDADEIAKRKMRMQASMRTGRRSTILSDLSGRIGSNGSSLGAGG